MKGNYVICKNRVVIEDIDVGQFVEFECENDRRNISSTATVKIPFYSIAMYSDTGDTSRNTPITESKRFDSTKVNITTGSRIDVYMSYDGSALENEFDERLVFSGFIVQVIGAFPTTLKCQDNSFILRYGRVGKDWKAKTTLQDILGTCTNIANDAFSKYRSDNKLKASWNKLSVALSETASTEFTMEVWRDISPYDALERLMRMMCLYCHVKDSGELYAGLGLEDPKKETIKLATNLNVIQCNIVPKQSQFTNYSVTVNGLNENGEQINAQAGDPEGEQVALPFTSLQTVDGLKQLADATLERLKGDKNKGTLTTLLYPECNLFDYVSFNHTLFPELSGNYYVIAVKITAGQNGYRQILTVTDETFIF